MPSDFTLPEPVYAGQSSIQESLLCEQCRVNPVRPPRGRVVARFCSPICRAGWHNEQKRRVMAEVRGLVDDAKALLDQALAVAETLLPKGGR